MGRTDLQRVVNGVFKGGGAKGILYGGALLAVEERGLWFRSVAGASAGAITAALVAAGLTAEQIIAEVPAGLRGVQARYLGDLIGSPMLQNKKLAAWLEAILQREVGAPQPVKPDPVTFAVLYAHSGIELNVVAVDVADRQPRVFSVHTTPTVSVTQAVLASSAIPMAFRPARLEVQNSPTTTEVHRLMDGGVWANYPAFVFKDTSFRSFHELPALPEDSTTVGFTLDSSRAQQGPPAVKFLKDMHGASHDRGGFLPWLFRNPVLRFYFLVLTPLIIVAQFWYTTAGFGLVFLKDYGTRDGVPSLLTNMAAYIDGFFTSFWPAWALMLVALVLGAVVAAVLGATIMDSGVPAMRTMMAVGTDVPYWLGFSPGDHVVRIAVPAGLTTTKFKLAPDEVASAVASGRDQAREQLATIFASESDR